MSEVGFRVGEMSIQGRFRAESSRFRVWGIPSSPDFGPALIKGSLIDLH